MPQTILISASTSRKTAKLNPIHQNTYIIKIFEYRYGKIGETINSRPVFIIALTDFFDGNVPSKIIFPFPQNS